MNRKKFSSSGYQDMERWFHNDVMQRHIRPGETRSGLVYTSLTPGTKGFNLDTFAETTAYTLTFLYQCQDSQQITAGSISPGCTRRRKFRNLMRRLCKSSWKRSCLAVLLMKPGNR